MPRIEDCIDRNWKAQYVTKLDLLKGYWQIPLTSQAKELSAFVTPDGVFQYRVMPFGMKNSPVTFQRMINQLIGRIDGCEAYIDDVVIHSTSLKHLECVHELLTRFAEVNLTINLAKSEFGHAEVTFLGHVVAMQWAGQPIKCTSTSYPRISHTNSKKRTYEVSWNGGVLLTILPKLLYHHSSTE